MKRFFTKKSVALILATIILVGFFPFNFVSALTCPAGPTNTASTKVQGSEEYKTARVADLTNMALDIKCKAQIENRSLTTEETTQIASLTQQAKDLSNTVISNSANLFANKHENILNTVNAGVQGASKIFDFGTNLVTQAIPIILENMLIPIAAFLLAIAGNIMDFSLQYTIYGSGFSDMNGAIQGVWVLIRDTLNIIFIFILLYAAIQQIVWGTVAKQILKSVIISAVLINFSLFTTKIIIDASNLVATAIYDQITSETSVTGAAAGFLTSKSSATVSNNKLDPGIELSGRLMDSLGLVTVFDISNTNTGGVSFDPKAIAGVPGILLSVVRLILFLTTTYVFLFIAAILVGRFIMLILLMATSPLAFLSGIGIPRLEKYSTGWWGSLTEQSLLAPAFTFLMLLTVRLAQTLTSVNKGNSMIIFFNFFLVVYLLLKSVSLLKELSGSMGEFAESIASKGAGLALGTITGGTALVARQTIGRGANALANSKYGQRLSTMAAEGSIVGGTFAKVALATTEKAAKGTFDVRNTSTFKEVRTQAEGIAGGIKLVDSDSLKAGGDYGKAGTGFAGMIEADKKAAVKKAEDYEETAKNYEARVVDKEIVERLKQEEIKKEKEIKKAEKESKNTEKDKALLEELKSQLGSIKEQRQSIQNNPPKEAIEKVRKSGGVDLATADNKITEFKKQQEDLERKKKEMEKEKIVKLDRGEWTEEMEKELKDIDTKSDELTKNIQQVNEEKEFKKIFDELNSKGVKIFGERIGQSKSTLETIKESKEVRTKYAKYLRTRILGKIAGGIHTYGEDAAKSRLVEKGKSDEDKAKDKEAAKEEKIIEKAAEKLAEKLEKEKK